MNNRIRALRERIEGLEQDLENEVRQKRQEFQADFENRKVRFEREVLAQQARYRMGLVAYMLGAQWRHVLSMPFIYPLIVPLFLLDASVSLYQWICFPLYRIPRVRRRDHFVFDRSHLAYLNPLEKLNCAYCSYGNGLVAYVREVVGRTEQYWCPIKHAAALKSYHSRYDRFTEYGDAAGFREQLPVLRKDFGDERPATADDDVPH